MKRALRGLMWVMLSTALVVMAPRAFAQRLPETHPSSIKEKKTLSYDRGSSPGGIELLARRTLAGYSTDASYGYGRIHLTCRSAADSANGRCPVADTGETGTGFTNIPLRFTEARSGMQTDVIVRGTLQRAYGNGVCYRDLWNDVDRAISSSFSATCVRDGAVGTGLELGIPVSELSRLVAGHWTAQLLLDLRTESAGTAVSTYEFNFDLTITDQNAVAIYFPQFDEIAPHVGMNLRYDPIAQTVGGGTTVDMCLYDGLGSQAAYLGVTVRDSGARAPGPLGFSAWHRDSGGSGESERLDYTVTLDHNGAQVPMRNGVEEQLTGIDSARLKLVLLPGMSQPVFCVPTPLRLEMPRVPIAEKQPGYYRGDLKVELRVPTGVP
ncbi:MULTISPECIES: CfaE/CblD family pilus tip adhesin [Stenotrophomonas maltophilia group]|uniref:CfaE/CblD family pilus tip adhesin n=1 Tax=Stenotrophomonas maltophilia group TaxID=995085 RepID=UPI000F690996|nr:CfaE/CblD family pilus tip adhesin [Stenotrophomonas maltophilia]RRU75553.1 pilin protein [Stenotrophomonas maltophilia]